MRKLICERHNIGMQLGGYPNKYYFCPECREEYRKKEAREYNEACMIVNRAIGLDILYEIKKILKYEETTR